MPNILTAIRNFRPSKRQVGIGKVILFIALLLPAAGVAAALVSGDIVDPAEFLIHETGETALQMLVLVLLITPLRLITNQAWLLQYRRMVGLYAFFYTLLHFQSYLLLDLQLDFAVLVDDIIERKYITVGFVAFVLLLPLAITSNNFLIRKMGAARWTRLHKTVYLIAVFAAVHYLWKEKGEDIDEPLTYLAIFIALIALRYPALAAKLKSKPSKPASKPDEPRE